MSLEEQAAERRAKLLALRSKGKPEFHGDSTEIAEKELKKPANVLKSRNFDIEKLEVIKGSEVAPSMLDENSETVEAVTQRIQDEVLSKFKKQVQQDINDIIHEKIKPKSLSWDLQRDIQDDLDLLQEKTDIAIQEILKERIRKLRESQQDKEEVD